ncbi:glycosyltransferase family 2 protein [Sphingobacterium athyrii]|uniref:glycosyltransferase family 2 protein n=1 Tax=Sphingobacterium athyrii TaxID=2152717 RepID=UPI0015E84789|nr:glycosyltransferase family 2 protein [Sphingobacterium athyrii]
MDNKYKNVKFSVITINYNNCKGLELTINSVVNQRYKKFQFIVIDGGSNDGSLETLATYQDQIDNIVSERDQGVYDAMNKGIMLAKGDYLIFMNSGDTFYDDGTLAIYDERVDGQGDVYYGNTLGLYDSGESLDLIQPAQLTLSFWLFSSLNHQSTAIKRSLFFQYGFYDCRFKITSDWQFFMNLFFQHQLSFIYIDDFLAKYDLHGISSDSSYAVAHTREREDFIENFYPYFWREYIALKDLKYLENKSRRLIHFEHLQQSKISYRLLKSFMDILLLFNPLKIKE